MLIDDNIKISLTEQGYLMNYPYHMVSISEMCEAFMNNKAAILGDENSVGSGMFFDYYPFLGDTSDETMRQNYRQLVLSIQYHLFCRMMTDEKTYPIPDWVYSYMLGAVISINSDKRDIHNLIYPLGVDNIDDDFDYAAEVACYKVSTDWVTKHHLPSASVPCDPALKESFEEYIGGGSVLGTSLFLTYINNRPTQEIRGGIILRPPTMFGEPHVVKSVRLSQIQLGR